MTGNELLIECTQSPPQSVRQIKVSWWEGFWHEDASSHCCMVMWRETLRGNETQTKPSIQKRCAELMLSAAHVWVCLSVQSSSERAVKVLMEISNKMKTNWVRWHQSVEACSGETGCTGCNVSCCCPWISDSIAERKPAEMDHFFFRRKIIYFNQKPTLCQSLQSQQMENWSIQSTFSASEHYTHAVLDPNYFHPQLLHFTTKLSFWRHRFFRDSSVLWHRLTLYVTGVHGLAERDVKAVSGENKTIFIFLKKSVSLEIFSLMLSDALRNYLCLS